MMRPKGGKRQPRYFQLRDAAATKMCMMMDRADNSEPVWEKPEPSAVEKMLMLSTQADKLIADIKARI